MRIGVRAAAAACLAAGVAGCGGGGGSSQVGAGGSSSQATTAGNETTTISDHASSPTTSVRTTRATTTAAAGPTLARGFHLTSPALGADAAIPTRYTCDGSDVSLPLRISGVPAGTRELVLIMRDPDAPTGNFVHWALAGIAPGTRTLAAGGVPGLVVPGRNSFGTLGYKGPCPPAGQTHHYVITLSALGGPSGLKSGWTADQLHTAAMGIATLIGTYRR